VLGAEIPRADRDDLLRQREADPAEQKDPEDDQVGVLGVLQAELDETGRAGGLTPDEARSQAAGQAVEKSREALSPRGLFNGLPGTIRELKVLA
jgi:hypothetical protein